MPAKFKRTESAGVLPRTASVSCACDGTDPLGGMEQEGTSVSGTRYHHQVKAGLEKGVDQPTNLGCDQKAVLSWVSKILLSLNSHSRLVPILGNTNVWAQVDLLKNKLVLEATQDPLRSHCGRSYDAVVEWVF